MNAYILHGPKTPQDFSHIVRETLAQELKNRGWNVEVAALDKTPLTSCRGCGGCWLKTPGICLIDDAGRDIVRKFIQSDLAVFLTPVSFGGYSSTLKKMVDRLIPVGSLLFTTINGETHHKRRYDHFPYLLAIGTLPPSKKEQGEVFHRLAERNAINFLAPAYKSLIVFENQPRSDLQATLKTVIESMERDA